MSSIEEEYKLIILRNCYIIGLYSKSAVDLVTLRAILVSSKQVLGSKINSILSLAENRLITRNDNVPTYEYDERCV